MQKINFFFIVSLLALTPFSIKSTNNDFRTSPNVSNESPEDQAEIVEILTKILSRHDTRCHSTTPPAICFICTDADTQQRRSPQDIAQLATAVFAEILTHNARQASNQNA